MQKYIFNLHSTFSKNKFSIQSPFLLEGRYICYLSQEIPVTVYHYHIAQCDSFIISEQQDLGYNPDTNLTPYLVTLWGGLPNIMCLLLSSISMLLLYLLVRGWITVSMYMLELYSTAQVIIVTHLAHICINHVYHLNLQGAGIFILWSSSVEGVLVYMSYMFTGNISCANDAKALGLLWWWWMPIRLTASMTVSRYNILQRELDESIYFLHFLACVPSGLLACCNNTGHASATSIDTSYTPPPPLQVPKWAWFGCWMCCNTWEMSQPKSYVSQNAFHVFLNIAIRAIWWFNACYKMKCWHILFALKTTAGTRDYWFFRLAWINVEPGGKLNKRNVAKMQMYSKICQKVAWTLNYLPWDCQQTLIITWHQPWPSSHTSPNSSTNPNWHLILL